MSAARLERTRDLFDEDFATDSWRVPNRADNGGQVGRDAEATARQLVESGDYRVLIKPVCPGILVRARQKSAVFAGFTPQ